MSELEMGVEESNNFELMKSDFNAFGSRKIAYETRFINSSIYSFSLTLVTKVTFIKIDT